jgi:hypothetical protein
MPAISIGSVDSSAAPTVTSPIEAVNNLKTTGMFVKPVLAAAGIMLYNKFNFGADLMAKDNMMEGAVMAVSVAGSDYLNQKLGLTAEMAKITGDKGYTSYITEAVVTGALYAGLNSYQIGSSYSVSSDFIAGAGADLVSSFGETMVKQKMAQSV